MVKTFQCDYTAVERVWGDIRLVTTDEEDAATVAKKEIEQMYPEYEEVTIEHVTEVEKRLDT